MTDFTTFSPTSTDGAYDVQPVTPDDDNDLPKMARAIRCLPVSGTAGTLRFTNRAGEVCNTEIAVGETYPAYVLRVHETGTTASGLEALF